MHGRRARQRGENSFSSGMCHGNNLKMFLKDHLVAKVLLFFIRPHVQWLKASVASLAHRYAVRAWLNVNSLSVPESVTWTVLMATRRAYLDVSLHWWSVPPSGYQLEAGPWILSIAVWLWVMAWWHCSRQHPKGIRCKHFVTQPW